MNNKIYCYDKKNELVKYKAYILYINTHTI